MITFVEKIPTACVQADRMHTGSVGNLSMKVEKAVGRIYRFYRSDTCENDPEKVYAAPEEMQEKHFTDYGHSVQQNRNTKTHSPSRL